MKYFLAECLNRWEIPYWRSDYFCGAPFLSDIQSGFFYPLSIIFLLFPFPLSFNLFIVIHFFIGFCFFYLFIRSTGLSFTAAVVTAISWCYGSYTISSINTMNNLSTLIWLPAILWSYNKACLSGKKSPCFLTVLFICFSILGGEPQLFLFIACLLLAYAFWFTRDKNISSTFLKNPLFLSCILITCGILLALIQLGMTYMDYSYSIRDEGLPYNEVARFGLSPSMLINLLVPIYFDSNFMNAADPVGSYFQGYKEVPWLLTIYPGFFVTIMALYGIIFSFSKKTVFWLILFIFSLLMALGGLTPLHYYFYKIFPFFRYPVKFYFISSFSMVLISAFGIEKFFNFLKSRKINIKLASVLAIILIITDLYTAHKGLNPVVDTEFYTIHHSLLSPLYEDKDLFRVYIDPEISGRKGIKESIFNHHFKWQLMQYPNLGILSGLYNVSGVPVLELKYQYSMAELMEKPWSEKIKFLRLANVKYIVSKRPLELLPELKGGLIRINPLLLIVGDQMPRAWVTGQLSRVKEGKIEELLEDSFNPHFRSLSDRELFLSKKPFFRQVDNIEYSGNGKIRVTCTTEENGILVLSESAYPGWKVYVDGKEKECLWLNLFYQGVEICKGKHEIIFTYKPDKFNILTYIELSVISIFIIAWIITIKTDKKRSLRYEAIHNNPLL
jgi:hypothetical protein